MPHLFISIFFLIGFAAFVWGMLSVYRGYAAQFWPTVRGEVLESSLQETTDGDGPTWRVNVRYRYAYKGSEFEGTRITFGYLGSGNKEEHSLIHAKLRSGSRVQVRHQRDDPANAVLAVGFNLHAFVTVAFGIAFLLFAACFVLESTPLLFVAAVAFLLILGSMSWGRIDTKIQVVE